LSNKFKLIKLSVSQTTQAVPIRLTGAAHAAEATAEVQEQTTGSIVLCTAPVVAVGTAIAERTIAGDQVPCSMEF